MTTIHARPLSRTHHELAEGPLWDAERGELTWVDIEASTVFSAGLPDSHETVEPHVRHRLTSGSVGAALPGPDGGLLLGAENSVVWAPPSGDPRVIATLFDADGDRRINDGICDAQGRAIFGTMRRSGHPASSEELLRLEHDGSVTVLRSGLTLSNGLAFTPDGRLFHCDTQARTVSVCHDTQDGTRWSLAWEIPEGEGMPDGMCSDDEGYLWLALWGAGQVRRYSPTGEIHAVVEVPAPHTSSAAFAGPGRDRLVITTAREGLDARALADSPESGRVFIADVGARGRAPHVWRPTGSRV